mmetsp:Transcript_149505/g.363119  ORF Transcript_149505/g.363119 Transcript_149505/m.363119 type:complete len:149 (-) Transcript_149505:290-736(-)
MEEGKKASAELGAGAAAPVEPTGEAPRKEVAMADAPTPSADGAEPGPNESSRQSDERAAEPAAESTMKRAEEATVATSPKVAPGDSPVAAKAAAASAASTVSTARSAGEESRADHPAIEGEAVPVGGGRTEAQKMPFFAACCGQSAWC